MHRQSFILGMITAFCECVAGGCKRLALSPPLSKEDFSNVYGEACRLIENHGLIHYHEENTDLPEEERVDWILIAAAPETISEYLALRAQGFSPARSLTPFHELLSYRPELAVSTGYDAFRSYFAGTEAGGKQNTLRGSAYPVLEFDENKTAKLNPPAFVDTPFPSDRMVITFFPEVIDQLLKEEKIVQERIIGGENPIPVYQFPDSGVLLTLGQVGSPACAGNLDLFHAMGIRRAMFCGGGGVLDKNIEVGQLLLVDGAIRDDGLSYQYIEPSRLIFTDPEVTDRIAAYLGKNGISYLRGLTWTTDALFRETPERIEKRKAEGAKIVEMEQAGCIAVALFRGFSYGALIYGGDDVSQEEWSNRSWRSRKGVRYDLVELCRRLTEEL